MTDIYKAWLSGGVNRWHQHDAPVLRNSNDTNWAHSCRVAQLVHLMGGTDEEIIIALFHDSGEKITGDKRTGTKAAGDYEAEADAAKSLGLHYPKTPLVNLCDKLDAFLWQRLNGRPMILGLADDVFRKIEVQDIMTGAGV
jgi:hypothetical protein